MPRQPSTGIASTLGGDSFQELLRGLEVAHGRVTRRAEDLEHENRSLREKLRELKEPRAADENGQGEPNGQEDKDEQQILSPTSEWLRSHSGGEPGSTRCVCALGEKQPWSDLCPSPKSPTLVSPTSPKSVTFGAGKLAGDWDRERSGGESAAPSPQTVNRLALATPKSDGFSSQASGQEVDGNLTPHPNAFPGEGVCPSVRREWLVADGELESQGSFRPSSRSSRSLSFRRTQSFAVRSDSQVLAGQAIVDEGGRCGRLQRFVVRPHSAQRMLWDTMSIFMISYDIVQIPLEVFELEPTRAVRVMEWITTIFWTIDIAMSFMTGFDTAGVVEMRPAMIARRYLRTWFAVDATIVVIDWTLSLLEQSLDAIVRLGKTNRATRLVRIVRSIKLIRVVKLNQQIKTIFRFIKSEVLRAAVTVSMLVVVLVCINHYLACGWYGVGKLNPGGQQSWLSFHNMLEQETGYIYATSLHWSLTQFTPAAMEVYPHNLSERIYSVSVIIFALVTFSFFVSSITSSMMHLKEMQSEPARQEAILRQYFMENKISAELGQSIWNFLKRNHFQHKKSIHRADVHILRLLPQSLRGKLCEELYLPVILVNPFLHAFETIASATVCEVAHRAVSESAYSTGDKLFCEGDPAKSMIFLTTGEMDYRHRDRVLACQLGANQWACEHVLWLEWVHCGQLVAHTSCETVNMDAKTFRMAVAPRLSDFDMMFVKHYAALFHALVVDELLWFTDISPDLKVMQDVAQRAEQAAIAEQQATLPPGSELQQDSDTFSDKDHRARSPVANKRAGGGNWRGLFGRGIRPATTV